MFRLAGLLGSDLINLRPDTGQFSFTATVHVDVVSETQRSQRYHDAANFLIYIALIAAINVVHKLMRFAGRAATGLHQFKRLFDEAMIALLPIPANFHRKAFHHPRMNALLERLPTNRRRGSDQHRGVTVLANHSLGSLSVGGRGCLVSSAGGAALR